MLRPMCMQGTTQEMTLQCECINISYNREGATNLRNYFTIADKKTNAETAVKVAGATAKHCIVIHGVSTFLSGEGHNLDYDQECFTRANVAHSRATDLTILACPLFLFPSCQRSANRFGCYAPS